MARTFSDEKREEIINLVISHILETGDSYRKTAEYLNERGINISHVTIKDYCDRYIEAKCSGYENLEKVIDLNTAKGVNDENVKTRVLNIARIYADTNYEIEEIADNLELSPQVVYNDLNKRLPEITTKEAVELYKKVKEKSEINSLKNLRNQSGR